MTTVGTSTLDGTTHVALTISGGSTYTAARSGGNDTTNIVGTITNAGTIVVNGGNGTNGVLNLTGAVTLNGGGTVTMAVNPTNGGTALLQGNGQKLGKTNNTTPGEGTIRNAPF